MAIPPLVLRIYADSTGVKAGVAQANAQVNGLRGTMQRNAGLIKTALITGVVAGIGASIKAASDLGEQLNRTKEVFEGSAASVTEFSENTAEGLGIAQAEALKAASNFGAMFDSAEIAEAQSASMSKTMVQLASDMASFNDQDPSEMLERLQSGLAGQARPLRAFGVFLSAAAVDAEAMRLGMERVNGEFTDAQKIQARYNIILQHTTKQQGDFQRTLGHSLPNQLRQLRAQVTDLAAKIGQRLIPQLLNLADTANEALGPVLSLFDAITAFGEKIPTWGQEIAKTVGPGRSWLDWMNPAIGLLKRLGVGTAEEIPITKEFAEVLKAGNIDAKNYAGGLKALIPFLGNVGHEAAGAGRAVKSFLGMTRKEGRAWATEVIKGFDGVGTALGNLADKAKLSAQDIIGEFKKQAKNIREYNANLQTVATRNIPAEVLDQLLGMGMEGADIMAALAGASKKEFQKIVDAMKGVPKQEDAVAATLRRLTTAAERLAGKYTIHIDVVGGEGVNAAGFTLGQRAGGGPVSSMRPYIVGERGPELFVPSSNGTIVPNNQLAADGGGTIVHVYVGEHEVEDIVVRAQRRAQMKRSGV